MKKKFVILFLFLLVFLTGCTKVQDMSLDDIINKETDRKVEIYNTYRQGYKYNVPAGIAVINNSLYNEVLQDTEYTYYLYIDAVSYFNKVIEKYEVSNEAYVSKQIIYNDKYGYLEITESNDNKYFIEIMYNYAKIEVIVKKKDINVVVANSLSILASINFDDNILKTLLSEEVSQLNEVEFNIFETTTQKESEYLQAMEDDVYDDSEDIHDVDLID